MDNLLLYGPISRPSEFLFVQEGIINIEDWSIDNCDHIREKPTYYSEFYKFLVSYIFDKLYHRANLPPSFRPMARFM